MSTFVTLGPEQPTIPLLVTVPHAGTDAPAEVAGRWTADARRRPDTDWHLGLLYDFVPSLGAQLMIARNSRYVVDLNRSADGAKLYAGRRETGLVPTTTFSDEPIYLPGDEPGDFERADRIEQYWRPWHAAVRQRLDALRAQFGYAILFDAHSIVSEAPRFFDGRLPPLMLGTVEGTSCDGRLSSAVQAVFEESPYGWALDAPFKGGFITRSFGAPSDHIHALQLEMSQRIYMDEGPPFVYQPQRAAGLKSWLLRALQALVDTSIHEG
ncbi:MAG: N-formylglutamate deformylase [Myxococcota bacterium]|jgi:N-formylglutamate deformylase